MQILEDAQRIADKCVNPDDRAAILKAVADLQSMTDALSELREQGLVRWSGLRMSQFEIAIRSMILCQSAAVMPQVSLSFSFRSHGSQHLIDFVSIDIVVSVIAVFRLVDNLGPDSDFALIKRQSQTVTPGFH